MSIMENSVSGWKLAVSSEPPIKVAWPPAPSRLDNWQEAVRLAQLDAFAALTDDWDGFGAAAPQPRTVANAKRLLIESASYQVQPSFVSPSSAGTVLFIWEGPEGEGHLEIGEEDFGFYTSPVIGDSIMKSGDIGDLSGEQLTILMASVLSKGVPHAVVDTHVIGDHTTVYKTSTE